MSTGLICDRCHKETDGLHIWTTRRRALGKVGLCDDCNTKREERRR